MDEAWRRVKKELADRGKSLSWLASRIGSGKQRVYNWQARQQLPNSVYLDVAAALGKSPNWLAGIDDPGDELSPMTRQIVRAFEKIESDSARLSAFVQIIETCARAADTSPEQAAPRPRK